MYENLISYNHVIYIYMYLDVYRKKKHIILPAKWTCSTNSHLKSKWYCFIIMHIITWYLCPNVGFIYDESIWNILIGKKESTLSSCKEPIFWWNVIFLVRRSLSEMGSNISFELNMFVSCCSKIQIASSLWSNPNSNYSPQRLFMMYRTSTEKSLIWPYSPWINWTVLRLQSLFVLSW